MVKITTFTAKIAVLFSVLILSSTMVNAQAVNEVTLTVSGDGATKTEATAMALRSAIEQAFGTFVSANTTILNDELVRDEIATVSSGNIKNYEEIVSALLPNGNTTVTLKATVSVSKLISYAQSKGSSAEFAGQTFAMNMKLKELNKANEEKAINNMTIQIYELLPVLFDYDINVGEPQLGKVVVGYDDYGRAIYSEEGYTLKTTVSVKRNANTHLFYNILTNTFKSLSLSSDEITEYEKTRIETYPLALYIAPPTERHGMNDSRRQLFEKYKQEYRFRSDAWQEEFADFFNVGLAFATFNFQIKLINNPDNISEIGLFNEREIQSHADKLLDVSDLKLMTRGYIAPLLRNHGDAKIYVPSFNKISEYWIEFSNFHYCSVLSKTTQLNEVADTNNKKKNREKKDKPSLLSRFAEGVEVNGSPLSSRQTQSMQTAQSVRVTSTQSIDLFDEKYDVLFTESFTLFIPKNEISSIQGFEIKRIP